MGGIGGTRSVVVLRPGEFITTIQGIQDNTNKVIAQLTFWTNRGIVVQDSSRMKSLLTVASTSRNRIRPLWQPAEENHSKMV